MNILHDQYQIPEGKPVDLAKFPTRTDDLYKDNKEYEHLLREQIKRLSTAQELLYASDRFSLLLIFQAMDAAGKDGAIKHVFSGINPQGCHVTSFKQPSTLELSHDFLWRTYCALPERGRIGIFNRSYYEEVLVVRVHPEYLAAQNLPDQADPQTLWQERFESIRHMEAHLHRSGTRIVKFFLHLSKDEQRERFLARIDEPEKHWKFSAGDVAERLRWDDYQSAYADCLAATSTKESPWYAVPADDKKNARLLIGEIVADTLEALPMAYPALTKEQVAELQSLRGQL
ncbi:MAG: polyphosphate kinase 2 family protein [Armatimonadetes bacterium]|nr:polyphosphate kinase 2 family protein [Armatimonadota bacterium]